MHAFFLRWNFWTYIFYEKNTRPKWRSTVDGVCKMNVVLGMYDVCIVVKKFHMLESILKAGKSTVTNYWYIQRISPNFFALVWFGRRPFYFPTNIISWCLNQQLEGVKIFSRIFLRHLVKWNKDADSGGVEDEKSVLCVHVDGSESLHHLLYVYIHICKHPTKRW